MSDAIFLTQKPPAIPTPLDSLPFIKREENSRDFWHITPSGNYSEEYLLGVEYARQFLQYLIEYRQRQLLGWIVRDMMRHNTPCGIELGFMGHVALVLVGS